MSTSLETLLNALDYRDAAAKRGIVKLLQVSGALGALPEVEGVLTDRQADAVLKAIQFDTPADTAQWLHDVTQAHLLRPQGKERYETPERSALEKNRPQMLQALSQSGMLNAIRPRHRQYKHALVLGAMEQAVEERLDTLKKQWDNGVRFDAVYLMGSERPLVMGHEASARPDGPTASRNEMDMMVAKYREKSASWPDELRQVPVFEVCASNKSTGERANTRDSLEVWKNTQPEPGRVLAISSQPHAHYQQAVITSVLPPEFEVDTIAATIREPKHVNLSVAADALARRIDAGFDGLQQAVEKQPAPPPQFAMLDPATLKVDPAVYQFRSHGDANGVTQKGRIQAEHWDPLLHGGTALIVHEKSDGSRFVADGHHRHDLAVRLNAQGKGPGQVPALVLREADGYTAQDVKIIAAYKNIADGRGDPMEAARVFKEAKQMQHPQWLPSLQMDKGNLKLSYSLSGLSDRLLKTVEQGDIPLEIAASVAERVRDTRRQDRIMTLIKEKLAAEPAVHSFVERLGLEQRQGRDTSRGAA